MDFRSSPSVYSGYTKPALLVETEKYKLKIVENEEELSQALRLRVQAFLHSDGPGELDRDRYDDQAIHFIALHRDNNEVCGTYRFINHPRNRWENAYSCQLFDLSVLPARMLPVSMEMGRTCVAKSYIEHCGSIIPLFWKGACAMLKRGRWRYLLGSVSVFDPEPARVWAMFDYLDENDYIDRRIGLCPAINAIPRPSDAEMAAYRAKYPNTRRTLQPLLRGYLSIGTKVISEPQYCASLGCAHFLVCLDYLNFTPAAIRHFMPGGTLPPYLAEL
ncbi:MAG: GNAT family N-acetyltransferase [Victivallaceae bacterium]|nr:GNAT family N-acetyltransferase [Victivallaceae bacterium]